MKNEHAEGSTSKSFVMLSGLTIAEKILGFLLQAAIASVMGATIITDCYYATFELTTLIDMTLVVAIIVVLLKQYADQLAQNGRMAADTFLSNARMIILPAVVGLCALIFLLARPVSFVLAPRYDETSRALLVKNIRLLSFLPAISTFSAFYLVILRQNKKFLVVGTKSLLINLGCFAGLGAYMILDAHSATPLCIAYNIGFAFFCLVTFLSSRKYGRLRPVKPAWTPEMRTFTKMLFPLVISNGVVRISLLVDRIISSLLGEGAVTCLTYAHMLSYLVEGVFIINISTVLLSDFVNLVAGGETEKINNKIETSLTAMIMLLVPVSIISVLCSRDIVAVVFGHGNFTDHEVSRVAGLLVFYAVGFVPAVISNIYMQVHYAFGKTATAMRFSIISIVSNIVLSLLLAWKIGLPGIAVGTAISYVISAVLYGFHTKKLLPTYSGGIKLGFLVKLVISSVICAAAVFAVQRFLPLGHLLTFAAATVLGGGLFFLSLILMREPAVMRLLKTLKKTVKRG